MQSFKPVQSQSQAACGWDKVPNFSSKNRKVEYNGKSYTIIAKEQRLVSTSEKIFYKILNFMTFGILSACSKNVKNICTKGKETIRFATPNVNSNSSTISVASSTLPNAIQNNQTAALKKIDKAFEVQDVRVKDALKQLAQINMEIKAEKHIISQFQQKIEIAKKRLASGYSQEEINKCAQENLKTTFNPMDFFGLEGCKRVALMNFRREDEKAILSAENGISKSEQLIVGLNSMKWKFKHQIADAEKKMATEIDAACINLSNDFRDSQQTYYTAMFSAFNI